MLLVETPFFSNTKPAKFLVFLVKDKGAPVVMPVK